MKLRHLRYFVAVAEELHFGHAATRLHISQPPLSTQISDLEKELGLKLFTRMGRSIELTAAGREYLAHARRVLTNVELAVQATKRVNRGEVGEVSVGFMSTLSYSYMPWLLREFRKRFPDVDLILHEMRVRQQVQQMLEARLQVGLGRPPIDSPELCSEVLLRELYIVVLNDEHRLAACESIAMDALKDEPFILSPQRLGSRIHTQVVAMCHDAGFSPKVAQEAEQMHTAVGLVSAGLGIAVVPASVQTLQMDGVVYRPLSSTQRSSSDIALIWRRDERSPVVKSFCEVVRQIVPQGWQALRRLHMSAADQ